jgi:CheY-like chemotaxis protein
MGEAFKQAKWNALVQEAQAGECAVAALRQNFRQSTPPDLFIVDCLLQGETCIETVKAIRAYPSYRCQPIVVLTTSMPPAATIDACHFLDVLLVLERPQGYPGLVKIIKQLKSHFVTAGSMKPGGYWIADPSGASNNAPADLQLG